MKWFFVILLLINVVYFGLELDQQTRIDLSNSRQALVVPPGTETLKLLRERQQSDQDKENAAVTEQNAADTDTSVNHQETPSAQTTTPTDVRIEENFASELVSQMPDFSITDKKTENNADANVCLTYGPFPDNSQVGELTDWFKQHHVIAQQRLEASENQQLFWIYLEPQSSRDNAMQAIEDLKSKGIRDYRLIETGDLQNAISLGLFSTQASVNKRLNELTKKGYQPVVIPYRDSRAIYWLDVKLENQPDVLSQMFTDIPSRYNSIPVDCSQIALK